MMSSAPSRFYRICTGVTVACVSIVFSSSQAKAQSQSTGDGWAVGASTGDNASVGIAATVDVPAPANAPAPTVRHSTNDVPAAQPQPVPAQLAAAPTAPQASPASTSADYEDADPSALDVFRSDLDPYGRWIDDSRYGRVWVPDSSYVGSDFAPYVSNGHWGLDDNENWVWVSDYPFGWVTFHYGRWVWIDSVGWSWIPGRRYAPAWVVWRVPTDDYAYVGWAPAPPTYVWFDTGAFWLSYYPPLPFVFCPSSYVFYPHFGAYLVRDRYFAGTLVRHSVWYSTAPIYGRGYASPPINRARVPAQALPTQRVSADPRAVAMSRTSASPGIAGRGSSATGFGSSRFGSRPAGTMPGGFRPSTTLGTGRPAGAPAFRSSSPSGPASFRSNSPSGGYYNFTSRPRPMVESWGANRQVRSLGSMPGSSYADTSRPSYSGSGASYSSPRYSAPSSFSPRSAPGSFSAPRAAGPSYSAPSRSYSAPSYSAPSRSYSAPSHSFSAPSHGFSGGGGGFRGGGGGGFRGGGGRHR